MAAVYHPYNMVYVSVHERLMVARDLCSIICIEMTEELTSKGSKPE